MLLVPLVLQLTIGTRSDGHGFNWELGDFVIAGALLFSTGLLLNLVVRKLSSSAYRFVGAGIIVAAFVLVWAELAVGLFGTPFAGS